MADPLNISRQLSLSLAMQAIVHCGPISRASIAKQTGLSKQTVSEVARILEEGGIIRETGRTSGHVGRSAVTYELIPDAALVAAIDLGGTKLRVALVDLVGTILAETVEPTTMKGGPALVAQIARLCRAVAAQKGHDFGKVKLAVAGCPGVPDAATGSVKFAPNIPGIDRMNFRDALAADLGVEVVMENDVNLAVLGEHWIGCGAGLDHLAYVALGTGIGAGLIVNGALTRGAYGAAGELGYLPFGADPFEAESLRVGALERVVATHGIRSHFQRLTGRDLTVPEIFAAAGAGDAAAHEVLQATARTLSRAIAAIASITNPELVILGGSIGARPQLLAIVRQEIAACFPYPIRIEPTALGNHAALAGAVAVGLTHLHTALFAEGAPGVRVALPTPDAATYLAAAS